MSCADNVQNLAALFAEVSVNNYEINARLFLSKIVCRLRQKKNKVLHFNMQSNGYSIQEYFHEVKD